MNTKDVWKSIVRTTAVLLLLGVLVFAPVGLTQTFSGEWMTDDDSAVEEVPAEVPAEVSDDGLTFDTPFLIGISHFLLENVTDCGTGEEIDPMLLRTQFVFGEDAVPPYDMGQLDGVIVSAEGYASMEITGFHTIQISLMFITITFLVPEVTGVCLARLEATETDPPPTIDPLPVAPPPPGPYDWGDAPDVSYRTTLAFGGACHQLLPPLGPWTPILGWGVDNEADGQPSVDALGDGADEDGVFEDVHFQNRFGTNYLSSGPAHFLVVYTAHPGLLDAWVDFTADGDWDDGGERIFESYGLRPGLNILDYVIPALFRQSVETCVTYARFRVSSAGCATPAGFAADGEVEDYMIPIPDFGDAPDKEMPGYNYPTLLVSDGARHLPVSVDQYCVFSPRLGRVTDADLDGHSSVDAAGDDRDMDDEGGILEGHTRVAFGTSPLIRGQSTTIGVLASQEPGYDGLVFLDAWIDFNQDGDWDEPDEQIFGRETLVPSFPSLNELSFVVPSTAVVGATYARFRVSSEGGLSYDGLANDGEVEDYAISIADGVDFGDAPDDPANPDDYPTLLASDGARHGYGRYLGSCVDFEADGHPSICADGDDIAGLERGCDDEDGVFEDAAMQIPFGVSPLVMGQRTSITVVSSGPAYLDAWVDFNADGDWADEGEKVFDSVELVRGGNLLEFAIPWTAKFGVTYARFRCSEHEGLDFFGYGYGGEVEDYRIVLTRITGL